MPDLTPEQREAINDRLLELSRWEHHGGYPGDWWTSPDGRRTYVQPDLLTPPHLHELVEVATEQGEPSMQYDSGVWCVEQYVAKSENTNEIDEFGSGGDLSLAIAEAILRADGTWDEIMKGEK